MFCMFIFKVIIFTHGSTSKRNNEKLYSIIEWLENAEI